MRFFWDLYDSTLVDDHGRDLEVNSLRDIAKVWDFFIKRPNNTVNRGAEEPGNSGRNLWDFGAAWSRAGHDRNRFIQLMALNCLLGQQR